MAPNTFYSQRATNDSALSESELSRMELLALEVEIDNQSDSDFFDLDNEVFTKNEEQALIEDLTEEDFNYDSPHPFAEDDASFLDDSESSESTDEDTSTFKQQIRSKQVTPSKTTEIIISNMSKPPMLASWKVVERPFGIIDGQSTKCIATTTIKSRNISSDDDEDGGDLDLEDFIYTNDLDENTSNIKDSKSSYLSAPLFAFRNRNTKYFAPSQIMRRRKSSTAAYSRRRPFISKTRTMNRRKSSSAVLELNVFDDLDEDNNCLSPLFGGLL